MPARSQQLVHLDTAAKSTKAVCKSYIVLNGWGTGALICVNIACICKNEIIMRTQTTELSVLVGAEDSASTTPGAAKQLHSSFTMAATKKNMKTSAVSNITWLFWQCAHPELVRRNP